MYQLVWLVPVLPLLGFLINGLLNRSLPKRVSGWVACGSVLASFVVSVLIFMEQHGEQHVVTLFEWMSVGDLQINFSFLVDPLSSLFLIIITGVGFLIHLYSTGYMHDDEGYRRYFAYLNLFVFFMLLLVLGDNFLVLFVGWEGVGLCSYLLIGYWFKNSDYNNAARKAFVMNRIGDLAFLLGVILIFVSYGAIDFQTVFAGADKASVGIITTITLLLFLGATGKSAQIPLYTWLPDAMAGPTPVSALIHAATMVTAGIYMIARSAALFSLAPVTLELIAIVGLATSLVAALIGIYQNDIKKVLAYSTVSQLGLMFLALGAGAYTAGVFHVTTHAFFKACLFLGAGSVIHAMSGEQDIRRMGGLRKYIPITYWTFLLATIAIAGIFPFAGFFSKDEILVYAFAKNPIYGWGGILVSLLTAFYMFRMFYLTFFGTFRGTHEQEHHLHESPASMTIPLIVLAALSVVSGFIGIPHFEDLHLPGNWIEHYLEPVVGAYSAHTTSMIGGSAGILMAGLTIAVLAVVFMAYRIYVKRQILPAAEVAQLSPLARLLYNKFYVDEIYNSLVTKPLNTTSDFFYRIFDLKVVDGIVNGAGEGVEGSSALLRRLQSGHVGFYLFAMVIGILLILALNLI
ncbi:MAG: NADH-quinone oxidoreductase subunit L [Saprospiraceae bacterium]